MNQSGQKQHLLRAKDAPDSLKTSIKVITDIGDFTSAALKVRAGNKDYAFKDSNTKDEQRYFRQVMLTQEAIDAFLREGRPEDRYTTFMDYQFGGKNSFEHDRKSIQAMLQELAKRVDGLTGQIKEIEKKNVSIENDTSSLTDINTLILELNELGYGFAVVEHSFSDEAKAKLLLKMVGCEQSNNKHLKRVAAEKEQLTAHLHSLPLYQDNYNKTVGLKVKISLLTEQKSDIGRFQQLADEKKQLASQLAAKNTHIEQIREKQKQLPKFIAIRESNSLLAKASEELAHKSQQLQNNQSKTGELAKQKEATKSTQGQLEESKSNAPIYFGQIAEVEQKIKQFDLATFETKAKDIDEQVLVVKERLGLVQAFKIEEPGFTLTSEVKELRIANIKQEYSVVKESLLNAQKQLRELEEQSNAATEQSLSITRLIELGSKLVNHSPDRFCPLCQHEHESFDVLIAKINSNSSLNEHQQRLLTESSKCQSLIDGKEDKLKQLVIEFEVVRDKMLSSLNESLENCLKALSDIDSDSVALKRNHEQDKFELDRLKKLVTYRSPQEFEEYITAEISNALAEVGKLGATITEINRLNKQLKEDIRQSEVEFALLKSQSEDTRGADFCHAYWQHISEYAIPINIVNPQLDEQKLKDFFNAVLALEMGRFEVIQQKHLVNADLLNNLSLRQSKGFFDAGQQQEQELEALLKSLNTDMVQLNIFNHTFIETLRHLDTFHLFESNDWPKIKQAVEQKISQLAEVEEQKRALHFRLESLRHQTQEVALYLEQLRSTDKLKRLRADIDQLDKIKVPLIADLAHINKTLTAQIDSYFHVELINTIYAKIDPHPDFKKVTFACEFPKVGEKGKPKLQVYITDKEGENTIAPTLDFSSAQVNVLSLSIFLAKALNTKNAEGKPVDCIFIDDPVQSMDSINVLGVIDLLRNLTSNLGKQIIISTHDENFHELLQQKLPPHLFNSKFLALESFGKVAAHDGQ